MLYVAFIVKMCNAKIDYLHRYIESVPYIYYCKIMCPSKTMYMQCVTVHHGKAIDTQITIRD